jgi:tetratricopeptide (TPR) repeat protein
VKEPELSLREIFDEIVDLPADERATRVASLTDDPALRKQALDLAIASDVNTSRATKIAAPMAEIVEGLTGPELSVGDSLGAWQLTRELGHGGMGAVYLAERRDGQFEQAAAIKLLQGFASAESLALLSRERQIMAKLSHPNIARLLDGGATPKGRPYLVMEYIDGVPLDEYVKKEALPINKRLSLFIEICRAVSFAHSRLVVHCDLKPSNIMVDQAHRPMLLDFGIATLIESDVSIGQQGVAQTRQAFTPRYASPELKAGTAINTATDVYSLGVVLGELVEGASNEELDSIVRRATMSEANLRYPSVSALAEDVERFLDDQPVKAKSATPAYVMAKLVKRRWPIFGAVSVAVAMAVFFVLRLNTERDAAVAAQIQATRAEAKAKNEAETARRVSEFVESLFVGADPDINGRQDVTALTLVERGKDRIAIELKDQPIVQSRLYERLAIVYEKIGRPVDAASLYDRAISVERTISPPQPDRLSSLLIYASLFKSNNKIPGDAVAQARESLALREATLGPSAPEVAQSLDMLGLTVSAEGDHEAAEPLMRRALAIRQLRLGKDPDDDLGSSHHNLGVLHKRKGDFVKAIEYYRQAMQIQGKRWGTTHPRFLNGYEQFAECLAQIGQIDEAEKIQRESLALRRSVHGDMSSRVALTMRDLGITLMISGKLAEAISLFEQSIAISKMVSGERSFVLAPIFSYLAEAHEKNGAMRQAESNHQKALTIFNDTHLADPLTLAFAQYRYGTYLLRRGDSDSVSRAKPLLSAADKTRSEKLAIDNPYRTQASLGVAAWQFKHGEREAAAQRIRATEPYIEKLSDEDRTAWVRLNALLN